MQFIVPKFIEKKAKIVGPFTFKQFIFIGIAGGICLFLYFTVPFPAFVILFVILLGGALALAFLKIGKTSLPVFIKNFFAFIFKPKVYLWRKKTTPPKVFETEKKIEEIKEEVEKGPALKVAKKGKLGELFTRIETKQ